MLQIYGVWVIDGFRKDDWWVPVGFNKPYCTIDKDAAREEVDFYGRNSGILNYEIRPMSDEMIALIPEAAETLKNWLEIKRLRIELELAESRGILYGGGNKSL